MNSKMKFNPFIIWERLAPREQRTIYLGAFLLMLVSLYIWVIAPMIVVFQSTQDTIIKAQARIQWLKPIVWHLSKLEHQGFTTNASSRVRATETIVSDFSIVNLSHFPLKVNVVNQQIVEIHFKKVPFDIFSSQLILLWKHHHWLAQNLIIKRLGEGLVSVNGRLERLQ